MAIADASLEAVPIWTKISAYRTAVRVRKR